MGLAKDMKGITGRYPGLEMDVLCKLVDAELKAIRDQMANAATSNLTNRDLDRISIHNPKEQE